MPSGPGFGLQNDAILTPAIQGETEAFIRAVETGGGFRPDLQGALVSMLACETVAAGGESDVVV